MCVEDIACNISVVFLRHSVVVLDVNFILPVMVYFAIVAQWTNLSSLVLLNPFVYRCLPIVLAP